MSHYTITARIGEGGMGVVYKALDARLNRPVAIKVISLAPGAVADRQRRFVDEARAASALNHPHIVAVYDIDRSDDVDFIAMEYVPGRTLAERIGPRGLPIGEAVRYLTPVADALSAAHAAGIVHRDLKPANIIVGDHGVVKLVDFGLAKLTEPLAMAAAAPTATAQPALTGPGAVIGTAAYMSPEQTRGDRVDQRADVWAFGCILYECLTGRKAFAATSHADLVASILTGEPDLAALPASTPPAMRQLIRRCLRKDVAERLRFIDPALLAITSDPIALSAPASRRWRSPGLAIVALASAAIVTWLSFRSPAAPRVEPSVVRLSMPFDSAPSPREWDWPLLAVSPDGGSLVFTSAGSDGQRRLHYRRFDRPTSAALPGTEDAVSPFFSPDGRWVAFFSQRRLKKVSVPDGVVQILCDAPVPYGGAWSRDDTLLFPAAPFTGGFMRVSALGGTPEPVTSLEPGEVAHRWPSISTDGSVVVFTTSNTAGAGLEDPRIVAYALGSDRRATLPVDATFARFAPDGRHLLLVQGGRLMAVAFDPRTLSVTGSPVPLMEGVMQAGTGAAQFAASASVLTFLEGAPEARRLVWVDRQGRVTPLDAPPRLYAHPRLSPDGRTVAVTITEPKNDVWTYDLARGTLSPLNTQGRNVQYPIWTPDSKRITYVSAQGGYPQNLFWKSADGTGLEERLTTSPNRQVSETWMADGTTLVFVEFRPGPTGWDILTLPLDPPRQPRVFLETPHCDCTPQISPSSRYVAHSSTESGQMEIQIHSFPSPGTRVTVSVNGGASAAWRGDERELFYFTTAGMTAVPITPGPPLVVGKPAVLFKGEFAGIQGKNYDVTRDGQKFLMVQTIPRERPRSVSVVLNWQGDFEPLRDR